MSQTLERHQCAKRGLRARMIHPPDQMAVPSIGPNERAHTARMGARREPEHYYATAPTKPYSRIPRGQKLPLDYDYNDGIIQLLRFSDKCSSRGAEPGLAEMERGCWRNSSRSTSR